MPPTPTGPPNEAQRLVALREHTLLSLCELSQELTVSLDIFNLADAVLLNLMGQLGTAKSVLWLTPQQADSVPVLVRSHGISRQALKAISSTGAAAMLERFVQDPRPLRTEECSEIVGAAAAGLMREAGIELTAPLSARNEIIGMLGVGTRIAGSYGPVEMAALQAAVAMVGVTVQNLKLYHAMLESNRQLRAANEDLRELDRLKSQFIQNVNHELRTPLTAILGYVDLLLDMDAAAPRSRDFLSVVQHEALRLQGLIETLLTFSAVSSNQLKMVLTSGSIGDVIGRLHAERQPGITTGLREFTCSIEPELPDARFEERRLEEVVNSLVDNAVKFTPVGTRIHLNVSRVEEGGRVWVRVSVEDNGPGIPSEALAVLFEAFRQADGSSTRAVGGMGIGLTVARQVARSMEGDLRVSSALGQGTTFFLLLPACEQAGGKLAEAA